MKFIKKLIFTILIVLILIGVWTAYDAEYREELIFNRYEKYGLGKAEPILKNKIKPEEINDQNDGVRPNKAELLFLLAGVDEGGGDGTRTDTLILVKVKWNGEVTMISIPRDTYCFIDYEEDKINHAHAYGGMQWTLQSIRNLLGIDLDYYIKIDMDAVIDIVDIVGGIQMDVQEPQASDLYLEEGVQKLDGIKSLQYIQYRKGFSDGDLGRVSSQQEFLLSAIPQILSPKSLIHLPALIMAINDYSETNINPLMIVSMLPSAFTIRSSKIETYSIPGEGGELDGISYYFLYESLTQELIDEHLSEYQIDTVWIP